MRIGSRLYLYPLKAEEREIGGLGIMMVKKSMDDIRYEYAEGRNRLTMIKAINF